MKNLGETLKEFRQNCPSKELFESIKNAAEDILEGEDDEAFIDIFGGYFYLVETLEDLNEIPVLAIEPGSGSLGKSSLALMPSIFDSCEFLDNNEFLHILNCTNNAGGNTYLIPKAIVEQSFNVRKSIELTRNAYY